MDRSAPPAPLRPCLEAREALSHVSATAHDLLLRLAGTSDPSERAVLARMLARAERVSKALWERVADRDQDVLPTL